MDVKGSDDNSYMIMQIKSINNDDSYILLFVILIISVPGVIFFVKSSPMDLLFLGIIIALAVMGILLRLIARYYRLFITLDDEKEVIYCSIYNIFRKKLKDYTFSYNSVADIKLLEVWTTERYRTFSNYYNRPSFVETEHYKKFFLGSYYAIKFIFKDNTDIILDKISGIDAESLRDTIKKYYESQI